MSISAGTTSGYWQVVGAVGVAEGVDLVQPHLYDRKSLDGTMRCALTVVELGTQMRDAATSVGGHERLEAIASGEDRGQRRA